jgi:MFS transporter, NNP family, nitrate/nitrite transporter
MRILFLGLFWSLWFLAFSTRTSLSPLLPVIEDELHLSHALSGGLYLALSIGYTMSLLLSGLLAPRIGYKRSILIGFVALAAALSCPWFARDYAILAGIFFLVGAGGGLYLPSAIPLLTRLYDARHWGKALSIHDTAASISILSIPFLTTLTLLFLDWRAFFVILAGACLLAVALFGLFVPDVPPQAGEERGSLTQIFRRPEFWVMVVLWMVAATANMGLYSITPLFLVKERGIPLETANTLFGFSRIGGVFATLLAGFLADRFGVRRVLLFVLLITGLSTVGIALAPSHLLLVIMLFVQAPLSNGFFPVGLVAISKLSGTGERSLFTGATISGGTIAGLGLAPLCLGAAADAWSFQAGILVTGGIVMAASFVTFLLRDI